MRLWTSETIGAFGRQVTALALPTVAILMLNAGPFEMGVLNGLEDLAFPLLGLLVGVWADRWRRRPIMVVANLGRMVVMGSVPFVFLFATLHLYVLYFVAFAVGVFTVFFDIAYQSYLPTLIERTDLIEGNSKLETSQSGARVVGPAIAGFLIQLVGAAMAIAADAAAFFISASMIFSIKKHEPDLEAIGERKFLPELKEGAATREFGLNGIANRKTVDNSCVITIPLTKPTRFAMPGEAVVAKPMTMLDVARRGPENTSVSLKRR